ncbi:MULTISPECIES: hypothetical protein [unclassified Azospirillum]|uniref:hypothetical protein n=1 Tax=unclassified Azospirillum TaxID=2630922 RepID=UPI000B73B5DF|nr:MULTISPECIES: hypothetical protein [unclassified Azospirillum]SNR85635.1 hypothetical protein SAMN05880556_101161 [Azospirillum sp. RU38E]SNS01638.1 hypothetical protein SAMN05880591_101161 [Azospirillum sp. RU37A]
MSGLAWKGRGRGTGQALPVALLALLLSACATPKPDPAPAAKPSPPAPAAATAPQPLVPATPLPKVKPKPPASKPAAKPAPVVPDSAPQVAALPPAPPVALPPEPARPAFNPDRLIGLSEEQVEAALGQPGRVEESPPSRTLHYAEGRCVLRLHLFMEMTSRSFRTLSYDLNSTGVGPDVDQQCRDWLQARFKSAAGSPDGHAASQP